MFLVVFGVVLVALRMPVRHNRTNSVRHLLHTNYTWSLVTKTPRLRAGEPALKGKEPEIQENIGQAYKVQPGERGAADQAEK